MSTAHRIKLVNGGVIDGFVDTNIMENRNFITIKGRQLQKFVPVRSILYIEEV